MSRSLKKTPICGITTAESEKADKQKAHRAYRRKNKTRLKISQEPLALKEVSDPWKMDKDGKQRFDPQKDPKLMRK